MASVSVSSNIKQTAESLSLNTCTATVTVTEKSGSVSTANNTSKVTVDYIVKITSNRYFTGTTRSNAGTLKMVINGTTVNKTIPLPNGAYLNTVLAEGSFEQTITHNTDGSKTIGFSAQIVEGTDERNYNVVWVTSSTKASTLALSNIPRASTPTVSKSSLTLNGSDSLVINTNRASTSFTHTLKVKIGTNTATFTDVGDSYTFKPTPSIWMPYMTSTQMTATVTCSTYNGATKIGSDTTCTFKVNVDQTTYAPAIDSIAYSDRNEDTRDIETSGEYIKGKSNFQAVVSFGVSDSDYVSLASATIKCGSAETTYTLSGTSGTVTFLADAINGDSLVITVVDARGTKVTRTINLQVVDYAPVSFAETAIRLYRVNSAGIPTEVGECLHYKVTVNCFDGSLGQVANTIALKCKYKTASGSEYSQYVALSSHTAQAEQGQTLPIGEVTTYTFEGNLTGDLFAYTSEYDLVLKVEDLLSSAESFALRINAGIPVFAWGQDHFDVFGELHVHDRTDPFKYETVVFNSLSVKAGDTITLVDNYCGFNGFLSNSCKTIAFYIPLPKIIPEGLNVTVEGKVFIRHADGGYIANNVTLASLGTVTCDYQYNQVRVKVVASEAFSFANNSVLSVTPADTGLTITFSTPN